MKTGAEAATRKRSSAWHFVFDFVVDGDICFIFVFPFSFLFLIFSIFSWFFSGTPAEPRCAQQQEQEQGHGQDTGISGATHVPDQTSTILCPRTLPLRTSLSSAS